MVRDLIELAPSVGIGVLFYFVIKAMLEGDRRERSAQAKWEHQHDHAAARNAAPAGDSDTGAAGSQAPAPEASGEAVTAEQTTRQI